MGPVLDRAWLHSDTGQVVHIHVPLSPSSIIWYQSMHEDDQQLGRQPQVCTSHAVVQLSTSSRPRKARQAPCWCSSTEYGILYRYLFYHEHKHTHSGFVQLIFFSRVSWEPLQETVEGPLCVMQPPVSKQWEELKAVAPTREITDWTLLFLNPLTALCSEKKHPLLFSFITSSQINQFAQKFKNL